VGYGEGTVSPNPSAGGLGINAVNSLSASMGSGANRQSQAAKSFPSLQFYYAKLCAALKVEKEVPQL